MDGKEQSHNGIPSGSRLDVEEDQVVDSKIGQRIWGRYATSPGVIPLDSVLQRASYKTQFGISRLPLLIDIQRRWIFANAPSLHGWPALLYAYPTVTTDALPTVTPLSEPSNRPGLTEQVSPAARTHVLQSTIAGVRRSNEPYAATTSKNSADLNNSGDNMVARSLQREVITADLARPAAPAPTDNGVKAHPYSVSEEGGSQPVVIDDGQQTAEDPTISLATGTDHLGTTILQRHLDGPAARTVQRTVTTPQQILPDSRTRGDIYDHVTPSISQDTKRPLMQPTVKTRYPTEAKTTKPPASSIGEEGRAILQRHLNRPSKGVIQRTMAPLDLAEPVCPGTPAPVGNGVKAHPHSVSEEDGSQTVVIDGGQQTAESPTVSSATSTDKLGTSILQRSLDDPAIRAVQRPTLPDSRTRGDIREGITPSISQNNKGPTQQPSAPTGQFTAVAGSEKPAITSSGHFGTSILQHYPIGPSEWIIQPMVQPSVLVPHKKGTAWSRQSTHSEHTTDMVEGMANRAVHSGDTFFDAASEMPVWRAANRHVDKRAIDDEMPFQNHSARDYRFDMPGFPAGPTGRPPSIQTQQETGSKAGTSMPTAPPPAELPTQTATEPASEVDVMGVADQVYEILVHRLASERERRGI
jgi:hypothetical protein